MKSQGEKNEDRSLFPGSLTQGPLKLAAVTTQKIRTSFKGGTVALAPIVLGPSPAPRPQLGWH